MKLPNGQKAVVDERKVREYLLSASHPVGRFKARFFGSTLCANVLETLTPIEFSVEGGEAEEHGVPEGVGLRG